MSGWTVITNQCILGFVKLQAFVFCDCYERGWIKQQAPNPEIVLVLPNEDLGFSHATRKERAAFVAWRSNACCHPEGMVTGGQIDYKLPRHILHRSVLPHKRTFPFFVGKVLGCQPHTRNPYFTFKQVDKLQVELIRLKNIHLPDPKLELELRCYRNQCKQLVRAAVKLRKPIAMSERPSQQ